MLRVSKKAQRVRVAQAQVAIELCRLQEEHDLTDVEMLQAVNGWQGTLLKFALRAERNPDDPEREADLDHGD